MNKLLRIARNFEKLCGPAKNYKSYHWPYVNQIKELLIQYNNKVDDSISKTDISPKLGDIIVNWNAPWDTTKRKLAPLYKYIERHFSMVSGEKDLANQIVNTVKAGQSKPGLHI